MDQNLLSRRSEDRRSWIFSRRWKLNNNFTSWWSEEPALWGQSWRSGMLLVFAMALASAMTWGLAKHRAWVSDQAVDATQIASSPGWSKSFWKW